MSETIKVTRETKGELLRVAADIQARSGRRVDLDEAIRHLLQSGRRRPEALAAFFGSVPSLTVEELLEERRRDEQRTKRKYGA